MAERWKVLVLEVDRFLFGDDVFVSYAREDAMDYALAVATELTNARYECYFDQTLSEPGEDLPPSLVRGLALCSVLLLIATPAAAQSANVAKEIRLFRSSPGRPRPLVIIDVDGGVEKATWWSLVAGAPRSPEVSAAVVRGTPDKGTLTRAINAAKFARRNARLRNTAALLLTVIAASLAAAWLSMREAATQRSTADQQAQVAQTQARKAKDLAAETGRLNEERGQIQASRDQVTAELSKKLEELASAKRQTESLEAQASESLAVSESLDLARGSESVRPTSPEHSLKLAVEAMLRGTTPAAESALIRAYSVFVPFQRFRAGLEEGVFSDDGSLFALRTQGGDDPVVVWNIARGERVSSASFPSAIRPLGFTGSNEVVLGWSIPRGVPLPVTSAPAQVPIFDESSWALTRDGTLAASLDAAASAVWLVDLKGNLRFSIELPDFVDSASGGLKRIASCAFLPGNEHLLVIGGDGHVYVVDIRERRIEREAKLEGQPKEPIQLRAEGDFFAVATGSPSHWGASHIEVWRTEFLERLDVADKCDGDIVAFSDDGELIAVAHTESVRVCSFSEAGLSFLHELKTESVNGLQFARDGALLVSNLWGARVYDGWTGEERATLRGSGRPIYSARIASSGAFVATSDTGELRLWDIRRTQDPASDTPLEIGPTKVGQTRSISPNGRTIVRADATGVISRFGEDLQEVPINSGCESRNGPEAESSPDIRWDASGERFIVTSQTGSVLVSAKTGASTRLVSVGRATILSPDRLGRFVARYDLEEGVGVCDVTKVAGRSVPSGQDCWASADNKVDPGSCKSLELGPYVRDLALSPDGSLVAAIVGQMGEMGVTLMERASRSVVLRMPGNPLVYAYVAFNATGQYLAATAEAGETMTSWEVIDGSPRTFRRRATIRDAKLSERMAINQDGRLLAGWDPGGTLKIWDAETGVLIKAMRSSPFYEGGAFVGASTTFKSLVGGSVRTDACRACRPLQQILREAQRDLLMTARYR